MNCLKEILSGDICYNIEQYLIEDYSEPKKSVMKELRRELQTYKMLYDTFGSIENMKRNRYTRQGASPNMVKTLFS